MKSFRRHCLDEGILDGVLNLGSKFMFYWKNHWLMNTKHGHERIDLRFNGGLDKLKTLFANALDKFDEMVAGGVAQAQQAILFYSRSAQQGFVSVVDGSGKNLQLITFLPPGRSNPKPGTERVVVEGIDRDIDHIVEID